jgi:hypothetical protein
MVATFWRLMEIIRKNVSEQEDVKVGECPPESLKSQWWHWLGPEESNNDKTLEQHLWRFKRIKNLERV